MPNVALIVGLFGQDGTYLARHLLRSGFAVHGTSRDPGSAPREVLKALGLDGRVEIHALTPVDCNSLSKIIERVRPTHIYNLSGQSSVGLSFERPVESMESIVLSTLNFLEALRKGRSDTRFYNAGSSEVFGDTLMAPATEDTPFRPKSPYGVAKAAAVSLVKNYREGYGLFACSGILFNHESPLRPVQFFTRKVTAAASRIARGSNERLRLGDLSPRRDFGWAPEYVEAMYDMMQQSTPEDFVIATGQPHSLEQFVAAAFLAVGLDWRDHVEVDPEVRRPLDIALTHGNAEKARRVLNWSPRVGFAEIVSRMVRAETEGVAAVS